MSKKESEESEVVATAQFERFSAMYGLCLFVEADHCMKPRDLEAVRRGVGLERSTLGGWCRKRDQDVLEGLALKKRGPKPAADSRTKQLSTRAQTNMDSGAEYKVTSVERF